MIVEIVDELVRWSRLLLRDRSVHILFSVYSRIPLLRESAVVVIVWSCKVYHISF